MPLCQPIARGVEEPSDLWVEEQRSDFLLLQHTTESHSEAQSFRVLLLHNEVIVATASTIEEKEKIWKICNSISEVVCAPLSCPPMKPTILLTRHLLSVL